MRRAPSLQHFLCQKIQFSHILNISTFLIGPRIGTYYLSSLHLPCCFYKSLLMDLPGDKAPKVVRKFLHEGNLESDPNYDYEPFRKQFYFFYGTLMDRSTLATILDLQRQPEIFRAKITGYYSMMWDQYPVLLDGPQGSAVHGVAYEVQSLKDKKRLEEYETDNYKNASCLIEFEDGRKVIGRTFKWNADKAPLKEGSFDLKDWQMDKLGL